MSFIVYKDAIREAIVLLGGKGTVFEIYECLEKNYQGLIEGKDQKTWKNTVRYNLCRGNFHQLENGPGKSLSGRGRGGCKYWYNGPVVKSLTSEEIMQKEFEKALVFINSNKEYREMMLDNYLEI